MSPSCRSSSTTSGVACDSSSSAVTPEVGAKIVERIRYSDPESWRSRMEFVDTAEKIIQDKPLFGIGLTRYTRDEAAAIRGRQSGEIEAILGYPGRAALIHRDDMVL